MWSQQPKLELFNGSDSAVPDWAYRLVVLLSCSYPYRTVLVNFLAVQLELLSKLNIQIVCLDNNMKASIRHTFPATKMCL